MTMEQSFKTSLTIFENNPLWSLHFPVPIKVVNFYKKLDKKRFLAYLGPFDHSMPCAIMSGGNDYYFIMINKPLVKKLKMTLGHEFTLKLVPDESEFGMPLCEELEVLLNEDPDFEKYFKALTPGKQRNIIYYVSKPKSSDLRIRTAIVFANHLIANQGKLDFKMVNAAMKDK